MNPTYLMVDLKKICIKDACNIICLKNNYNDRWVVMPCV